MANWSDIEEEVEGPPAWLASYSDMMTDLLAIFVVLFAFAMLSNSQSQYATTNSPNNNEVANTTVVSEGLGETEGGGGSPGSASGTDSAAENASGAGASGQGSAGQGAAATQGGASGQSGSGAQGSSAGQGGSGQGSSGQGNSMVGMQNADEFDRVYQLIKEKIAEGGYADSIIIDKNDAYITFRFKDNVLFYPDSPVMRETHSEILQYMGDLLLSVDNDIYSIEISGHTARVQEDDSRTNYMAWELSSDRAIAVLDFFVNSCGLPQTKMVVSGYSHNAPIAGNSSEEERAQNRRVEVKIVRRAPSGEKMTTTWSGKAGIN